MSQYCNGSRVPPEFQSMGYQVPPGISDATVPNPIFNLTPAATVDEGNNWINLAWGPLAITHPLTGATLGNYAPAGGSPVINYVQSTASTYAAAPDLDFFGTARKVNGAVDVGAVEFGANAANAAASVSPSALAFGSWAVGSISTPLTVTVTNTGNVGLTGGTYTFSALQPFSRPLLVPGNCGATLAVGASCTFNVVFSPTAAGPVSRTLTVAFTGATVASSVVNLSGNGVSMSVNPGALAFGSIAPGNTSLPQFVTVRNSTGATRSLAVVVTAPFSRPAGLLLGGTCGTTLANNATCTIGIALSPASTAALGPATGTLTVTSATPAPAVAVVNSPVALTGTIAAPVASAALAPATWVSSATRGCTVLTCPIQVFTLTNTGTVTLNNIAQAALSGLDASEFSITRAVSTCGPAGNGQLAGQTSLVPGASCAVTVRFTPLTSQTTGLKSATLSITDVAGTQSSALQGTAN